MPSTGTQPPEDRDQSHMIEPISMRVPEACRYLGIGRSTLYVLIAKREIEIIKLGSSTLALTESLSDLIERKRNPQDLVESSTA